MSNMIEAADVEYLTVQEVAKRLKVCDLTVYRKVKRGELVAVPIGFGPRPHLRIPVDSLAALVSGRREATR